MSITRSSDPSGKPQDRRKLIAIVYADMVGYSRLIGLDDSGTLERLKALRSSVIARQDGQPMAFAGLWEVSG
jgi:hypothetical protein